MKQNNTKLSPTILIILFFSTNMYTMERKSLLSKNLLIKRKKKQSYVQRSKSLGNMQDYTTIKMPKIKTQRTGLTKTQKFLVGLGFTMIAINTATLAFDGYAFYEAYTVITSLLQSSTNTSLGPTYP